MAERSRDCPTPRDLRYIAETKPGTIVECLLCHKKVAIATGGYVDQVEGVNVMRSATLVKHECLEWAK